VFAVAHVRGVDWLSVGAVAWCIGSLCHGMVSRGALYPKTPNGTSGDCSVIGFVGSVLTSFVLLLGNSPQHLFFATAIAAAAAWLHWLRFHVPITVAAGVAAGAHDKGDKERRQRGQGRLKGIRGIRGQTAVFWPNFSFNSDVGPHHKHTVR